MREKVIGYSVACCLVLGVIYLKDKVFKNREILIKEKVEEEIKEEAASE